MHITNIHILSSGPLFCILLYCVMWLFIYTHLLSPCVLLQLKAHNSTPVTDNSRLILPDNDPGSSGSGSQSKGKRDCCARS